MGKPVISVRTDRHLRGQTGLALLEVLVAIALMGFVIFLLGAYYPLASLSLLRGGHETGAAAIASQRIEHLRSRPFVWVSQANVNALNALGGNPNCPNADTELLNERGTCFETGVDEGIQYTRTTTVTTSYPVGGTPRPRLTKVLVAVSWPEGEATEAIEFSTLLVDVP